ncbi:MAG TPA: TonB-dependent receptor [Acidobacteriaceae bacterium]|jgi:hypothetical protein
MVAELRKISYIVLTGLLLFFIAAAGHAQSTGSITGTVSDPSGASIPAASVTIADPATGLSRTVVTNGQGAFTFPDVPIGTYAMTVSKTGFATQKRSAQELLTGQTIGLDIVLAIGSNVETVEVTDTEQIKTSTSEVSVTIDQKQMQDLPLNQRNPIQLTSLTPGAVLTTTGTESGQQDQTGISVNGLRPTQNNFQLDGVTFQNRFFDSVPTMPSPDGLQEFTMQAANFSAEHSGAGALVQLSSRSGTNQLHGDAFEFIRNTVLNAYNYFPAKVNGKITNPPFKLNQFGGTVGGPIIIPHIYNGRDKTFFFFSAEDLQRRSSPTTAVIYLPTAAELRGDFSAFLPNGGTCPAAAAGLATSQCKQIYDPVTHAAIAGNIITTPIDPLSAAVAAQYTSPLLANADPTSGKYTTFENQNIDSTQYLIKVDQQIGSKDQFNARYFYNQNNFQRPFAAPLGFYGANYFRNQNLALSDIHTFSNTLTAHVYLSAGRYARTQVPYAPGLKTLQDLGATGVPLGTNVPIFPGVRSNISGYVNIFSGGALTQAPTSYEVRVEVAKQLGRHTLNMGFSYERTLTNAVDYSYTPGDNTFNGSRTESASGSGGNVVADFYYGLDSAFFQDNGRKFYLRQNRPAAFIQDDWKLSRKLTINAGLRYDPWLPPIDENDTLTGFIPGQQSKVAPGAPAGLLFVGDAGIPNTIYHNNLKDFAPRLGFAYNVDGRGYTVVRGAYGIFYGFPEGLLYQRTDATQPVDLYYSLNSPAAPWENIYEGVPGGNPFPRGHVDPSDFANYTFILPVSGGVLNPKAKVAYSQDYNLTVEQRLPGNYALSVAYVGNHVLHVMSSRQFNPAVCAPGVICPTINNTACLATCTSSGTNENARRLYPGLGAMEMADSYQYAIYNSLQVTVTHRVSRGLTLLGNVVWGKIIDNGSGANEGIAGPPNPFNLNSSRGPADFDQRIRANISANYRVKDTAHSGIGAVFLNGWQVNAILQSQTGLPFTVTSGTDRSLSGIGNDYADAVPGVNPHRPAGVDYHKEFFNTAAFVPAALGTFGDVHRNNLTGPGYQELDGSFFKDFFTEHRVHGQFRAEGFNLLNHANFANPSSAVNSGSYGQLTGTASSTGTGTTGLPRVFQFGAKVLF